MGVCVTIIKGLREGGKEEAILRCFCGDVWEVKGEMSKRMGM